MNELTGMNGALFISITAFSVVFVVLGAMALFMLGLGRTVSLAEKIQSRMSSRNKAAAAESTPASQPQSTSDVDDETLAAVTAAVSMIMGGQRFRVADIRQTDDNRPAWTAAGRTNTLDNKWSRR